jgi:hypothetical protein
LYLYFAAASIACDSYGLNGVAIGLSPSRG